MDLSRRTRERRALLAAGAALLAGPAAAATPRAPLLPGLDTWHMPTETRDALAQRYHDQGLLLAFGFNPEEAARSFEAALDIDPACASSAWALAWTLGPTINADMRPDDAPRQHERIAHPRRARGRRCAA